MKPDEIHIRPRQSQDQQWIHDILRTHWGSTVLVSRGQLYDADRLAGFIACFRDDPFGLVTYHCRDLECEIISLNSVRENMGVGTRLLEAVTAVARRKNCRRLWLITSNDNIKALRFYQKRGFLLVAIHRDAIALSRKLKPEIPLIGSNRIPVRDEIELEIKL